MRDEDGEIVAAVLAMTDATIHQRQEERLTYLVGLLDNTEDAIVALDAEWFVTVWTRAPSASTTGRRMRWSAVTRLRSPAWR